MKSSLMIVTQRPPTQKSRANSAKSTKSSHGVHMTDHLEITSKLPSNINQNIANFDSESDLLIYYSTLPNHLSWSLDRNDGTIFIKSFCDVLNDAYKNLANNLSLAQIITTINESVSNKRLQISVPEFRMNKEISFLPKDVSLIFRFCVFNVLTFILFFIFLKRCLTLNILNI